MKKVGIFFSILACFTASYSFACGGYEGEDQNYGYDNAAANYDNNADYGSNNYDSNNDGCCAAPVQQQECAPADVAISRQCKTLYCHWEPCYYNKTHCTYVPKVTYKKCCRYVPQCYEKQCCRYVPQYYSKTCTKYVPQYYYTSKCVQVPKYTQERCCKYVKKYYYKDSCQKLGQEVEPQGSCAPACAPCGR